MRTKATLLAGLAVLANAAHATVSLETMLYQSCVPDKTSQCEIYVQNGVGKKIRLTNNDVYDVDPVWSPDRTELLFSRVTGVGQFRCGCQAGMVWTGRGCVPGYQPSPAEIQSAIQGILGALGGGSSGGRRNCHRNPTTGQWHCGSN